MSPFMKLCPKLHFVPGLHSLTCFQPGDPAPKATHGSASSSSANAPATGMGSVALYFIMLVGGGAAFAAYKYLQAQEAKA